MPENRQPAGTEDPPKPPGEDRRESALQEIFLGPDGLRAGWGLALFLLLRELLTYCVYPLVSALLPVQSRKDGLYLPQGLVVYEFAALVCVLVATLAMGKIEHRSLAAYGLRGHHGMRYFSAGLGWGFVLLSLLIFVLHAAGVLNFDGRQLYGVKAVEYGLAWLIGFLLVGLFEEILSRGYTQATLARGIRGIFARLERPQAGGAGFWTAAFLTSFGFGFGHRDNTGESLIGLVAAGLIGLVFCLSLWRTGSLWWAIGFHASWDWAQSFFYGVADSGTVAQGHLLATHPVGRAILSGGSTGPEGSLFVFPIVALTAVVVLTTLTRDAIQDRRGV